MFSVRRTLNRISTGAVLSGGSAHTLTFWTKRVPFAMLCGLMVTSPSHGWRPRDISALARSAHAASPLAFLVVESRRTRVALGELVTTMSDIQRDLDDPSDPADKPWPAINKRIKAALDKFEDAARQELEVRWTSDRDEES